MGFYPVDDVPLALGATNVAKKEVQKLFLRLKNFRSHADLDATGKRIIPQSFAIAKKARIAAAAAAAAVAAAAPGDVKHAHDANIARYAAASAAAMAKAASTIVAATLAKNDAAKADAVVAAIANADAGKTAADALAALADAGAADIAANAAAAAALEAATASGAAAYDLKKATAAAIAHSSVDAKLRQTCVSGQCTVCYKQKCYDQVSCGHTVCRMCITTQMYVFLIGGNAPKCPICLERL